MLTPVEPELTNDQRRSVAMGVAQFNRGLYVECHETLEDVWRDLRGGSRDFFQALIQVSVGFHHLERGNRVGALRTFARALGRFEPYPAHYFGFDVAAERRRVQEVLSALGAGTASGLDCRPSWRFDDVPAVQIGFDKGGPSHNPAHERKAQMRRGRL